MKNCKARRHADQFICHACGLTWDVSDPDRPACLQSRRQTSLAYQRAMAEIRAQLDRTMPAGTARM